MAFTPRDPYVVLLAAGASRRMRGADKLLEHVNGEPLLRRIAREAASATSNVIVVLPADDAIRRRAIQHLPVRAITAPESPRSMAASIGAGISALPPAASGALLVLTDMPEVTGLDIGRMLEAHQQRPRRILRAASNDGSPGNPVLLPRSMFDQLMALQGDAGARELLQNRMDQVDLVRLPGRHAMTDLDTPEEWSAWRARHSV